MLDVRDESLHVRGWLDHTYDMQRVYRGIQVRGNIRQDEMYRWNVWREWPVQSLRCWNIFVGAGRIKLCDLWKRQEIQRLVGDHVLDVRGW